MKFFRKKRSPVRKAKPFEVYRDEEEIMVNSPSKSPKTTPKSTPKSTPRKSSALTKENDDDNGLNTSRKLASAAVKVKERITKPFSAIDNNLHGLSFDESNPENSKMIFGPIKFASNAGPTTSNNEQYDFDDLMVKEVHSPPRIPVAAENVFSPTKRVLYTDKTRPNDRLQLNSMSHIQEVSSSYNNFEQLSEHIKMSLNDKRFSDVVIRCGMSLEHKFYAHRIILSNRSRYFQSLFSATALDLREGRFSIDRPTMFADIFYTVLEYMYTGFVQLRLDNVLEVLSMSEEFGIDSLKILCERFITQNIDVNNACLLLEMSRTYNATELTQFVLQYIDQSTNIKLALASECCSKLSRDTFKCIIERETLQLQPNEEIQIFNSLIAWIKNHEDEHIDEILTLIRFPIMSPQQLSDIVEPSGIVPQELLFEAYRHHLVPQKSNHFYRFMHRNSHPTNKPKPSAEINQSASEVDTSLNGNQSSDEMSDIKL